MCFKWIFHGQAGRRAGEIEARWQDWGLMHYGNRAAAATPLAGMASTAQHGAARCTARHSTVRTIGGNPPWQLRHRKMHKERCGQNTILGTKGRHTNPSARQNPVSKQCSLPDMPSLRQAPTPHLLSLHCRAATCCSVLYRG